MYKTITSDQFDEIKQTKLSGFLRTIDSTYDGSTICYVRRPDEADENKLMINYYNEIINAEAYNIISFREVARREDNIDTRDEVLFLKKAKAAYSRQYNAKGKIAAYEQTAKYQSEAMVIYLKIAAEEKGV